MAVTGAALFGTAATAGGAAATAGAIGAAGALTVGGALTVASTILTAKSLYDTFTADKGGKDAPAIAGAPTADAAAVEANKMGLAAQKKQRQAAAAAVGRGDTILTGAGGLGDTAAQAGLAPIKTILGG
jgi:hypothetical protein